jgi:hypothetical protein
MTQQNQVAQQPSERAMKAAEILDGATFLAGSPQEHRRAVANVIDKQFPAHDQILKSLIHAGKLMAAVSVHIEAIITNSEGNADPNKPFSLREIAAYPGVPQGCSGVLVEYSEFLESSLNVLNIEIESLKKVVALTEVVWRKGDAQNG